jgi:hypothetical protein
MMVSQALSGDRPVGQRTAHQGRGEVDTTALNAFGIVLAALGAVLLYVFAIRRPAGAEDFLTEDVHIVRDRLHETVDIHSERVSLNGEARSAAPARREALGFLGFLALIDGFFLQFLAALETMRVSGLLP